MLKNPSKEDFSPFEKLVINIIVKNKYIFLTKFQQVWMGRGDFGSPSHASERTATIFRMTHWWSHELLLLLLFLERGDIF